MELVFSLRKETFHWSVQMTLALGNEMSQYTEYGSKTALINIRRLVNLWVVIITLQYFQ